MNTIADLKEINKFFLHSQALNNLSLPIYEGECLGIVGHNGAGKSTMVNILTGTYAQTSGKLIIDGHEQGADYDVHAANRKGIRVVFQELSLCPNLSVIENMRVFHPALKGSGWRRKAEETIMSTLDAIFPGHGIRPKDVIEDLSLGQRQIMEIAKAFTVTGNPPRLVILDEPTSALDHHTSRQLIDHLISQQKTRISCIYISHLLEEVLACTNRIMVMKDGVNVGIMPTKEASRQTLIELMGEARPEGKNGNGAENKTASSPIQPRAKAREAGADRFHGEPLVIRPRRDDSRIRIRVHRGEAVGLTGLAGHGQTRLLVELFDFRKNKEYVIEGPVTFIPGDRQSDGIFPLWSIVKNATVQVLDQVKRLFLIEPKMENLVAEKWRNIVDIKAGALQANILSLSGGNQQKVLFARCLESKSPVVLMDDPTRGVDVGTKEEIYKLILGEKRKGRSFVWYSTEVDELRYCDTIYVFKAGAILAEMAGDQATEEDILKASF